MGAKEQSDILHYTSRDAQIADLLVFLPSWVSFVVQGACTAVMLAVLVYIRLDKRHVAVDEIHQPQQQLSTFQPAANVTAVQYVHYTTLDPHTILLSLLALAIIVILIFIFISLSIELLNFIYSLYREVIIR